MGPPLTINHRIVEGLYCEALVLADEVRHVFALQGARGDGTGGLALAIREDESECLGDAVSSEGLQTTTRMMHAVAWLLNRRAYFRGEISAFQLKRYGRLTPDVQHSDDAHIALLAPETQELIARTKRFYERLLRLDRTWRRGEDTAPSAIAALRERLERRLAG